MAEATDELGLVHHVCRDLHAAHAEHEVIHALELGQSGLDLVAGRLDSMEAERLDLSMFEGKINIEIANIRLM